MVSVPADSEKRRAIKRKEGESLDTPYAIEMLHITKRFPGIIANDDITLQVKRARSTPYWAKTAPASPR